MGSYTPKETVIIVTSVFILLFGGAFLYGAFIRPYLESGGSTPFSGSKEITISYTALKKTTIIWSSEFGSYSEQPDSGKVFLEVTMAISNN